MGDSGSFTCGPAPALRPLVVEYRGFARDLAAMGGFTISPDRFGELICCADPIDLVGAGGPLRLPACFLIGLLGEPLRIESPGVVRCLAARLQPWSLGRLAERLGGGPPRPLQDAGGLFGDALGGVLGLVARRDWTSVVDLFDQTLGVVFHGVEPDSAGIGMAVEFVAGSRPTTAVARGALLDRRQVERRVRGLTGTSPKRLACLSRFQRARDALWAEPTLDLARLAGRLGYADQAHMSRHFRRYSGQTPGEFARDAQAAWGAPELGEDVAFVQDDAEGGS